MTSQKSMLQIIKETAAAYTCKTRSVSRNACVYFAPETGRMCAVGRCLLDPASAGTGRADGLWPTGAALDTALKPEYRGHPLKFWVDMQRLHDSWVLWNDDGLSPLGVEQVERLIKLYANDKEDSKTENEAANHGGDAGHVQA